MKLEPCTTKLALKRHVSAQLAPYGGGDLSYSPGRWGRSLCSQFVIDQEALDHLWRQRSGGVPDIDSLPHCLRCRWALAAAERG